MKISDEAVEAGYDALTGDLDKAVMRRALEAARPYLMPDREALVKVIMGPSDDWLTRHQAELTADRVLALFSGGKE